MQRFLRRIVLSGLMAFVTPALAGQPAPIDSAKASFVARQTALGFSEAQIDNFLLSARYNPKVLDAINQSNEFKPWYQYRSALLTAARLNAGLEFWHTNEATLTRAAETFGVEPQLIVAIIGIETHYGKSMGMFPVKDALFTLGFHYKTQAGFFLKELGELQQLEKSESIELANLSGSHTGAMGLGQFMPSSYRYYGVDFDGDGKRDLLNSVEDTIGSIANYFHQHGWQSNEAVAIRLMHRTDQSPDNKLWHGEPLTNTVAEILGKDLGLSDNRDLNAAEPAMLIKLQQENSDEYWLGLTNFYVITRYNRSPLYAMAAYEFSNQLKLAYAKP
ncbi:lytic murein transglycosylase B [Shewanella sp.]|uniref:lytic murein transglycosylase B n=1 Tax=Shewanella sp. TaxID=50422 RepID=UPI003566F70D